MNARTEINPLELCTKWTEGRFLLRSGYYAGRPPSRGDLDSEILEMMYQGIRTEVSEVAAKNFVNLVNVLDDLSASSFIVAFEKFWSSGCTDFSVQQKKSDRMELSAHGDALHAQALFVIATSLGNKLSEEEAKRISQSIKLPFIGAHQKELTR